eukprot:12890630-Prorocentrum_lima.AAC.1
MTLAGCPPQIRMPAGSAAIRGVNCSSYIRCNNGVPSRSTRWLPRSTCSGGQATKKTCVMYNASGMYRN